jgi:multimeric flavodoxin WrbA
MATEYSLKEALQMLEERGFETVFWGVRGKRISFCTHCDHCLKGEGCIQLDDVQALYSLLEAAEGLVIATPVYNGGVSAQLKAVLDRTRALFAKDPALLRRRTGMAIAVGGDRSGGQELAIQQILTFYTLNGVLVVSGGAFGANLGATFWSKDTLEGVMEDDEGLRSLRKTMRRFGEHVEDQRKLREVG